MQKKHHIFVGSIHLVKMADIFLQCDISDLLNNRFIVIIGDSIQRAVYKDIVMLLQKNKYLTERDLRAKGETSFSGDKLIEGGQYGEMTNGVRYREVRQYQTDYHLVRFYFVTRCYNGYVESILSDMCDELKPDVWIMNSCLWDISRYGSSSVTQYKKNLDTLFKRLNEVLPSSCLVIWNMTLPISKKARGGVLIPEVEHLNVSLRLDILEANFYVHKLALQYGYNTLDLHYYLRHQLQRRAGDGVHWDMTAHRRITNMILTHIAEAWNKKPPNNARKTLLDTKTNVRDNVVNSNRIRQGVQYKADNFNFGLAQKQSNVLGNIQHGQFNNVENNQQNNEVYQFLNSNRNQANVNENWNFNQQFDGRQQQFQAQFNNNFKGFGGVVINQDHLQMQNNNYMDDQQHNIDRYGGPINQSTFSNFDMPQMQIPNLQVNIINDLGPYRNDNFVPNVRRNPVNKNQMGPYRGYAKPYQGR